MKLLKALFKMFAFFAAIHVTILLFLVLITGKIEFLNVFTIIGLNHFFPGIDKGSLSQILSVIIITTVYLFFYFKKFKK